MSAKSHEKLKAIRFEEELLPQWAQLLDLAAALCEVPEETRQWFSRLTHSSGVDDARTVIQQCDVLRANLEARREAVSAGLERNRGDAQPSQIVAAWMYALETMIQAARSRETCSWVLEGGEDASPGDSDGGEINLRRV